MILPFPKDINFKEKHHLTFTLVFLNVFLFLIYFWGREGVSLQKDLFKEENMRVTARVYYEYLKNLSPQELQRKPGWLHQIKESDPNFYNSLSIVALRDRDFLSKVDQLSMSFINGDEVAFTYWQEKIYKFKNDYFSDVIFTLGLSSFNQAPLSWITYQFSHSGWLHLISNLMFLIFIAVAVEELAGGIAVVVIYTLGGIFGGFAFLALNNHGAIPMVGASASISSLLAFYVFMEPKRRIRYLYFLSPIQGHYGPIFLPTLLIIPLYLLVDITQFLSTPEGLGAGVAYSAHLGGAFCGAWVALIMRFISKRYAVPFGFKGFLGDP